jgi:prepilin-type processing-associated H-X9-DG protein
MRISRLPSWLGHTIWVFFVITSIPTARATPQLISVRDSGVNHGHSTSFAFADGHAELHEWQNAFLTVNGGPTSASDNVWLAAHATISR